MDLKRRSIIDEPLAGRGCWLHFNLRSRKNSNMVPLDCLFVCLFTSSFGHSMLDSSASVAAEISVKWYALAIQLVLSYDRSRQGRRRSGAVDQARACSEGLVESRRPPLNDPCSFLTSTLNAVIASRLPAGATTSPLRTIHVACLRDCTLCTAHTTHTHITNCSLLAQPRQPIVGNQQLGATTLHDALVLILSHSATPT